MAQALSRKWAINLAMHAWRAVPRGAFVVLTLPRRPLIAAMAPKGISFGGSTALLGLLFWPAVVLSFGLFLRFRSGRLSDSKPPQPAIRRPRQLRLVPSPGTHLHAIHQRPRLR